MKAGSVNECAKGNIANRKTAPKYPVQDRAIKGIKQQLRMHTSSQLLGKTAEKADVRKRKGKCHNDLKTRMLQRREKIGVTQT